MEIDRLAQRWLVLPRCFCFRRCPWTATVQACCNEVEQISSAQRNCLLVWDLQTSQHGVLGASPGQVTAKRSGCYLFACAMSLTVLSAYILLMQNNQRRGTWASTRGLVATQVARIVV